MKKLTSSLLVVLLLAGIGTGAWAKGGAEKKTTLTALLIGNIAAEGLKEIAAEYNKTHPDVIIDITAIDGVTDFNTALTAKIQAKDTPDILYMQWDTQITKFAQNGYILPLDDLGLDSKIVPIKKKINVVNGKPYAYPGIQSLWGMFWNQNLAKKYGVTTVPTTIDECLTAFETMRKNGLQYPFLVPGMDLSGSVAWIFAYMHQQISGIDPLFYLKLCTGEKSFAGSEIRQMYDYYGKVLEYAPPDIMGVDPDEFRRRFAREEFVMTIQGTGMINQLHTLNPNFQFILAPSATVIDPKNAGVISDFDAAFCIGADSKNVAAAKEFYKFIFEPKSATMFAEKMAGITPVLAATPHYDPAIASNIPLIQAGKFVGFSERDWIPGIKDVLKKNTQDWMSKAATLDQALNNLQSEHQRLIKATPAYVDQYKALLTTIGLLK